ncbi:hypothetical protein J8L98_14730 [Pseudoalteromonas sp. MMG013]|nr:hypothetical protein [Pseudoalteromonas sp. MMG013]
MTQRLTDVVVAADNLTQTVQDKIGNIDATVAAKSAEVDVSIAQSKASIDNFIVGARGEASHILLSKNQRMEPLGTTGIKHFNTIGLSSLEVIKEATLHGNPSHDVDHTGNSVAADFRANVYDGYVNGYFNILRIKWTRNDRAHPARIDDNWFRGYQQGSLTTACYLKLISGDVEGSMQPVISYENDWSLYGFQTKVANLTGQFHGSHTKLALSKNRETSGEALICLFGTASGYIDLEKVGWGIYPEFARPTDIPAIGV